jgi:hypothetical protein
LPAGRTQLQTIAGDKNGDSPKAFFPCIFAHRDLVGLCSYAGDLGARSQYKHSFTRVESSCARWKLGSGFRFDGGRRIRHDNSRIRHQGF